MKFRFLTAGESHGKCLTVIIEGMPSGIEINPDYINLQLARRQQGYGRGGRMKIEKDKASITSGVRHGFSTGAPIAVVIENKDWENWTVAMSCEPVDTHNSDVKKILDEKKISRVRPGHADLAGALKYNHDDVRNILERSSARETAARTTVGAFAGLLLKQFNIEIFSHVIELGSVKADKNNLPENYSQLREMAENSDLRCADEQAASQMRKIIDTAAEEGNTLGGIFEVIALNLPIGLGSFVHWDRRLDGQLAQAVMSIPAIKSVSIGLGEDAGRLPGSQVHDEIFIKGEENDYTRKTNNAGGIEGGMSNGMPLIIKAAMKPIPTMKKPLNSINLETGEPQSAHFERSDTCALSAAAVVGESMIAIVLADAFLDKFGGDSFREIKANYENYKANYQAR